MFFGSILPCQSYIILDGLIEMSQLRICFEGLTLCFLPFNLFWLLTYTKLMKTLVKFTNMVYIVGIVDLSNDIQHRTTAYLVPDHIVVLDSRILQGVPTQLPGLQ